MLTLLPWIPQGTLGLSDWGNNYFLVFAVHKTGIHGLQQAISSGWVRGAITGLGTLNLMIAFWEIAHFRQTVSRLQGIAKTKTDIDTNADRTEYADHLSDHRRPGDKSNADA